MLGLQARGHCHCFFNRFVW